MRYRLFACTFAAFALLLDASFSPAAAQTPAERPTITVTDFDYGTVAAQLAADKKTRKRLEKMGIRDAAQLAEALGVGAADMIVERLVATGNFRVLERKQLAAVEQEQRLSGDTGRTAETPQRLTRARYIVSGSVTRLGFEEKNFGGAAGKLTSAVYGLGARKSHTDVHLTARLIDTETGEIIASFTGHGRSEKGWGLTIFWIGGGGGLGGATTGSSNIRESAIGEATERAAESVVEHITAMRGTTLP